MKPVWTMCLLYFCFIIWAASLDNQIFAFAKNQDADQLCGNCTTFQHLCFQYTDSKSPVCSLHIWNFKLLAIFCGCTGLVMPDLEGNPEDWFSRVTAHFSEFSATWFLEIKILTPSCKNSFSFTVWIVSRLRWKKKFLCEKKSCCRMLSHKFSETNSKIRAF